MRDIKFRAYDKFAEKMMDDEDIGVLPSNDTIGTNSYGNITLINASNEYYVIMQYTGLNDKNGTEIYDGDIVMVTHPHDTTGDFTGTHGQVFYDDTEGAWYHVGHHGRPPKRMWEYCEVVGNIYENPTLLESHT